MTPEQLQHLSKRWQVDEASGCWTWGARRNAHGYGWCAVSGCTSNLAHRAVYEHYRGPIPASLELDHLCRNRACVNPAHLEAVTHAENCRRGLVGRVSGEVQRAKTHCPQGHEYNEANTGFTRQGHRVCRQCAVNRERAKRERLAALRTQERES